MNKAELIAAVAAKTGDTKKVAEASVKIFLRHERNPCQTIIKQNKVIHIYNNMHSLLKKRILSVCLFSSCMLQKYKKWTSI